MQALPAPLSRVVTIQHERAVAGGAISIETEQITIREPVELWVSHALLADSSHLHPRRERQRERLRATRIVERVAVMIPGEV